MVPSARGASGFIIVDMPFDTDANPRPAVFVHDFAPVDLDYLHAGEVLTQTFTPGRIADAVRRACERERLAPAAHPSRSASPHVTLGPARWRADAVVVPMTWQFPLFCGIPLEADIELAFYTPGRCHLHLLGRVPLYPNVEPGTRESSLYGRRAVAVIRRVLNELASDLTTNQRSTT